MFTVNFRRAPEAWKYNSELALLKQDFYPERGTLDPFAPPAIDRRQAAIDLVAAYLFRNPTTPHALTATANLNDALLHESRPDTASTISDNAMRSIYAMAFVKFVNGFVDRDVARTNTANLEAADVEQPEGMDLSGDDEADMKTKVKGGGESSMYAYASRINMPEDFVDLRHSIVHGDIPSLDMLRMYNRRALDWLWDKWWTKNVLGDSSQAMAAAHEQREIALIAAQRFGEVGESLDSGSERVETTTGTSELL